VPLSAPRREHWRGHSHRAKAGAGIRGLECSQGDWCPPYSGYHLFYPSRRQSSAAFALVVQALRHRGAKNTAAR
jgi:hypothetical protein